MTRVLLVLSLLGLACSSGGSSPKPDGGTGGATGTGGTTATGTGGAAGATGTGGAAGAGTGGAAGAGNQALCTSACASFTSCGVTTKSTCVSDCQSASTGFRTCLGAAGSDCNALAICYFQATATSDCAAGGGVPAGTATCAATDSCEGTCNTNSSGPACRCACVAAADPSVANLLLGINSCASDTCASACSGTSSPDCNTCFDTQCQTPRTACLAH